MPKRVTRSVPHIIPLTALFPLPDKCGIWGFQLKMRFGIISDVFLQLINTFPGGTWGLILICGGVMVTVNVNLAIDSKALAD